MWRSLLVMMVVYIFIHFGSKTNLHGQTKLVELINIHIGPKAKAPGYKIHVRILFLGVKINDHTIKALCLWTTLSSVFEWVFPHEMSCQVFPWGTMYKSHLLTEMVTMNHSAAPALAVQGSRPTRDACPPIPQEDLHIVAMPQDIAVKVHFLSCSL